MPQSKHLSTVLVLQLFALLLIVSIEGRQEPTTKTLSPDEWTSAYTCNKSFNGTSATGEKSDESDECQREPTAWRWKYIEELYKATSSKILVKENSIDERLANIIHVSTFNIVNVGLLKFAYNAGDSKRDSDNTHLVAGPQVDDKLCGEQLKEMLNLLNEMEFILEQKRKNVSVQFEEQHFRLGRILDSFGRYESGTLSANTHLLGSYRQCIGTQLLFKNSTSNKNDSIRTRFCWAKHSNERHLSKSIRERQQAKIFSFEDGDFKLSSGVCLPSSCHSKSFNEKNNKQLVKRLIDSQLKFPQSIYMEESLELDSVFCLVDGQSDYAKVPISGRLFLAVAFCWFLLLICATIKNRQCRPNDCSVKQKSVASPILSKISANNMLPLNEAVRRQTALVWWRKLDLIDSWNDLFDWRQQPVGGASKSEPVELDVLNPVKSLICISVIYFHAVYMTRFCTSQFLDVIAEVETDKLMLMILASPLLVDTFFVISCILFTYLKLKELTKAELNLKSRESKLRYLEYWFRMSTSRYLRLVPLFLIVFWFKKSLFIYLGDGPLWDSGLNLYTNAGMCLHRSSWFYPLNVYPTSMETCLPQAWSVSNELFFGVALPPFMILLEKSFKIGFLLVSLTAFLSTLTYLNAFYAVKPAAALWEFRELRSIALSMMASSENGVLFITPSYRLNVALCGLIAGFALFKYNRKNKQQQESIGQSTISGYKWPRWFVWPATIVASLAIVFAISTSAFREEIKTATFPDYRHSAVPAAVIIVFVWSAANAALLTRLMTDWKDTWLGRVFANKFWNFSRKLCYSLLLVHFDLILYQLLSADSIQHATKWSAFSMFASTLLIALPISVFAYIFIERPIDMLLRGHLRL